MVLSLICLRWSSLLFLPLFFFNDTATTQIYTLSLHDALPISVMAGTFHHGSKSRKRIRLSGAHGKDRKSTRLNSSHANISYAVFCLKKKNKTKMDAVIDTQK